MQVLNVVSVLSAREGGGNAERTVQLSRALSEVGATCTVLTLDIGNPLARASDLAGARLALLSCLNCRFQLPLGGWGLVRELVRRADVIHLMGYWSMLGVMVSLAARRQGIPYVVSPAGALPLFGRSRWLKRAFNWIVGKRLIRKAAGWIAITHAECADFEAYGIPRDEVVVLPNGVLELDQKTGDPESFLNDRGIPSESLILFMGRLNSIKGPDMLLEAFAQVAAELPATRLIFAGPDEGLGNMLGKRAEMLGLSHRIHFVGFVAGTEKFAAYRAASLLVVPSRFEAMSIVAVEAGICGTPVLMTDQCGLNDPAEINAGLVVSASAEGLAHGLRLAFSDRDRLKAWGTRWQSMVRERFLWRDLAFRFKTYLEQIAVKAKD